MPPPAPARPRVLHVFPTFAAGGAQVRAAGLANTVGRDWRHTVLALDGVLEARDRLDPQLEVRALPAPPKAGSLLTARRLRALLAHERPDLVLTYNFGAIDTLLAARTLPRLPLVHHEDGFHSDESQALKPRRAWLRRLAFPAAFRVVVISRNLERIALEVWRQPRERVVWLPNGIDVASYARGRGAPGLRRALGIPDEAVVVGSVGHLRPEKNVGRLLRAAARALERGADLHLLVLGDGPDRAGLERLAAEAPLSGRVHFVGYQPDPREHYRALDVLALSSDTEQMPLALIEAMAASLPVVSTDVGDVRDMLPAAQQPCVVPLGPDCEERLGAALARLAADGGLRARLAEGNLERARARFERAAMIEAYRELYARALASRTGA